MLETPLTMSIIGANVMVSMLAFSVPKVMEVGMLVPYRTWREGTWFELITSGFLHGSFGHLLFNMFTFYFFGSVMEQVIGITHLGLLYVTGLLASSVPSLIKQKNNPNYATIGASGAVESVLFAFILLFPLEPIYIMFIPIGIPAVLFAVSFVIYSVYASKREGTVNHEAHLAGAAWGIIHMLVFVPNARAFIIEMLKGIF